MVKKTRESEKRRARLVEIARSLPEVAVEPVGERHVAMKVRKKIFAYYLFDHHGDGRIALVCKAGPGEQGRLVEEDPGRFFVPPYVGPRGWVGVRLDRRGLNWPEATYLLLSAYRLTAPRALAAQVG